MMNSDNVSEEQRQLDELLSELSDDLEPLPPSEGIEQYIEVQATLTEGTKSDYERKLEYLCEFLKTQRIDNLNDLTGRVISNYRCWRRDESSDEVESLSSKTIRDDMYLVRDFIRFLESIEAVPDGLSKKVPIPRVDDEGRDISLSSERLEEILNYLEKFEYATFDHVLFALLREMGRRIGGYQSLDLADYHPNDGDPYLEFNHRPGETRLKNGYKSEGPVSISQSTAEIIEEYEKTHRHDVTDDFGRQPLLTTKKGRPATSTLRRRVYKWTRPCEIGNQCPHEKEPETCEAAGNMDAAAKCDSSRPPHALRHGYLTELRREGAPIDFIQDRCDVSERVLDNHYDERSEEEKREQRRNVLEEIQSEGGGYL